MSLYLTALCGGLAATHLLYLCYLQLAIKISLNMRKRFFIAAGLISIGTIHSLSTAIHRLSYHSFNRCLIALFVVFWVTFISMFILASLMFYCMGYQGVTPTIQLLRKAYFSCLKIALCLNLFGFVLAYTLRTDKLTDLSYGLTFLLLTTYMFAHSERKSVDCTMYMMIMVWAFRLSFFLFRRILIMGKDHRFDVMRSSFWQFGAFWLLQAVTVSIVLIPVVLCLSQQGKSTVSGWSYGGILVFMVGLVIETIADYQKFAFMQNAGNKDGWIMDGLWRYSRHPNYFGEILCWIGVYLFALPYLNVFNRVFAAISPCYIAFLLVFVSGIPILEKRADERWFGDEQYEDYCRRTSILIPWFVE